ncbi:ATP-dependent DNA ligase [Candidatus Collierbacteria bacterium]|nr:ATP-dependent DNA ligase [Candidatus Collierbacteria bacterium]
MKFSEFAIHLEKLEKISSRLAITDEVASLLKKLSRDETEGGVYLLLGKLAPSYVGLEFNLGWKMLLRSISQLANIDNDKILADFKSKGDMGEVIMGLPAQLFAGKNFSVGEVYEKLVAVADLLLELDQLSAKFIARIVIGRLRLGFLDKTILDALSVVSEGDKSARKRLDEAYQILPDVGLLSKKVLGEGLARALSNVGVEVGVPVIPALCQRLNHAVEIIEKMGEVAAERKYDGTRVQIHYKRTGFSNGKTVKTFTRSLEETSLMFPELTKIGDWIKADEVVLDCEAVGYDPETDKTLPFQMTITRKRKHGIEAAARSVPLRFFVFDILAKDGETLLHQPYSVRREILDRTIGTNKTLVIDETHRTTDPIELHKWHEQFLKEGFEGAVIKKWIGNYLPGRQGWNWVKIKEKEGSTGKLSDTLDLIVMGYYRGRGKRSDFGLGAFLVGVRKGDRILTIAKIGTGLSDEQFREIKKRLDPFVVSEKPGDYEVDKALTADVWVEPGLVVEIAADEITKSPVHTAGAALRFPRLIKFRDDKNLDGVTTIAEIESMKR